MTKRSKFAALAGAAIFAALSSAVFGQGANPTLIGQYGDWGVYVSQGQKAKVCFALTQPKERLPATLNRDPGYLFISTRPADNVRNEFSVLVGFQMKEDADPSVTDRERHVRALCAAKRRVDSQHRRRSAPDRFLAQGQGSFDEEHVRAGQSDNRPLLAFGYCPGA